MSSDSAYHSVGMSTHSRIIPGEELATDQIAGSINEVEPYAEQESGDEATNRQVDIHKDLPMAFPLSLRRKRICTWL